MGPNYPDIDSIGGVRNNNNRALVMVKKGVMCS